jgi:hypothetical protein
VIVDQENARRVFDGHGRLDRFGHLIPFPSKGSPGRKCNQCNVIVTVRRPHAAASALVGNQRSITAP